MTCAEFEVLLCDYLDAMSGRPSTLTPEQRVAVERHRAACSGCAQLAEDAGAAVAFMAQSAEVEPPPELLTRILFELPAARHKERAGAGVGGWFHQLLGPVLQPRFAMGMALTILSFSMMAQCAGVRVPQLRAADLSPRGVWAGLEDRAHRTWDRTLKSYQSIRFVYEMQTRLREWTEQEQEEEQAAGQPTDDRRLPAGENARQPDASQTEKDTSETQ
ncbi:MAG: zf-HC2 domain-containing protein [Bryobacterales bacterium]|nr:zf-HC2 domain-containing protein [Bryobacterales bacterium]